MRSYEWALIYPPHDPPPPQLSALLLFLFPKIKSSKSPPSPLPNPMAQPPILLSTSNLGQQNMHLSIQSRPHPFDKNPGFKTSTLSTTFAVLVSMLGNRSASGATPTRSASHRFGTSKFRPVVPRVNCSFERSSVNCQ